jgi:hypothetical protein
MMASITGSEEAEVEEEEVAQLARTTSARIVTEKERMVSG